MTRSHHLRVRARLENLADIREFAAGAAREAGLAGQSLDDLLVAVDEAVTNVILHGYRDGEGEIDILVEEVDRGLVVRLRDDAPAFDPVSVRPPELGEPLLSRPVGGMGVYLMRTLTDSLSHRMTPSGRNETVMVKKIRD